MAIVEYVCVFVRAAGDRLAAAERLLLALPGFLDTALLECDLRYRAQARFLGIHVRMAGEGLEQARRDRLAFWTVRAGGRAVDIAALSADDREKIDDYLSSPSHARTGVPAASLFEVSGQFFTEAGAPADRRRSATERPVLLMDVGGPGWDGVRYEAASRQLRVAAPIAPPVGDRIPLAVRVPGAARPIVASASVTEVRTPSAAGPGLPAGYVLSLEDPPAALEEALARHALEGGHFDSRAAPRFQVNVPVKVIASVALRAAAARPAPDPAAPPAPAALAPVPAPAAPSAAGPAHALIEYATDQELAADFIENLSQGGAFVRSPSPPPVGTAVELQLKLPSGADLHARATVAFVNANGMGVRFQLDPEAEEVLSAAMASISARPRRALVIDDDDLVCRVLSDALRDRGFEVLTSTSATEGLSTLSEELLALDLLVTDVLMPEMGGEDLVRLIRKGGGELDLAIVCVSGQLADGMEQRLETAGADAVLDKALGPDLIAQAADAVVERKRLVARAR